MTHDSFSGIIEYFPQEGKANLRSCLRIAFEAAISRGIDTVVMFTGTGEGPEIAIEEFRSIPTFKDLKIIAVTFPPGQNFANGPIEISARTKKLLDENGVPLIRAHMPFNPIAAHYKHYGALGQDLSLIGNVLSIFGGSMSLCVQAAIMAADAGCLKIGDHVIAMTSDTAIIVRTAPTERLLTDFIVREILCKPLYLTIAKKEQLHDNAKVIEAVSEDGRELPPPPK